jgi:hypothetical protein
VGVGKSLRVELLTAVAADLRFPQVEGRRTKADRLVNRYLDRYRIAASADAASGAGQLGAAVGVKVTDGDNATLTTPSNPPNRLNENVTPSAIENSQQQLLNSEAGNPIYNNGGGL